MTPQPDAARRSERAPTHTSEDDDAAGQQDEGTREHALKDDDTPKQQEKRQNAMRIIGVRAERPAESADVDDEQCKVGQSTRNDAPESLRDAQ